MHCTCLLLTQSGHLTCIATVLRLLPSGDGVDAGQEKVRQGQGEQRDQAEHHPYRRGHLRLGHRHFLYSLCHTEKDGWPIVQLELVSTTPDYAKLRSTQAHRCVGPLGHALLDER